MLRHISILLLLLYNGLVGAQPCNFRLSGHVEDADTKEKLVSATVQIKELKKISLTNTKGDFVFPGLCAGEYTLIITHVHCDTVEKRITLGRNVHIDVFMPHTRNILGSVTVEAQRGVANTGFKKELTGQELEQAKGLSLAEALSRVNGVTMLQTGSNISKPVIHGLHSNRVLTINNGVRQEGQQWGNEHAPEIDPFIADKLVVIKGVDELRYGSDAIGGVILVEPRALPNKPGSRAEINTAFFTNNRQYVFSGVFEQQLKKQPAFRYRVQGTYKRGANATTPHYRLNNTGNEEKNFSLAAGWRKEHYNTELFYSFFSTRVGIFAGSHIGNITDLQNAIAAEKPDDVFINRQSYSIGRPLQEVEHHLFKSKTNYYHRGHKFLLLLSGQYNNRKEFDVTRNSTGKNPQLNLSIFTFAEELSWEHPKKNGFSGTGGLSFMQQNNNYNGRYFIPKYFSGSWGAYYIEKWGRHRWELQGGLRFDKKNIETTRLRFNADTVNYGFSFSTFATSLNAIYTPNEQWKLNIGTGLASRAPYVNELLSDGIHHGTATYEKGDLFLQPEQSLHVSAGISYQQPSGRFTASLLLYSNHIRNFIFQQPVPGSPVLTIAGAFPLLRFRQTNAMLNGVDFSARVKLHPQVEWTPKVSLLYARNTSAKDWLILMPANRFSNEITARLNDGKKISNTYFALEAAQIMRQRNVPGDGNGKQDYKEPPSGYLLFHLNTATTFSINKIPCTLGIGIRNLGNTVYRDYMNSMRYFADETGRNISIRLNIQL